MQDEIFEISTEGLRRLLELEEGLHLFPHVYAFLSLRRSLRIEQESNSKLREENDQLWAAADKALKDIVSRLAALEERMGRIEDAHPLK